VVFGPGPKDVQAISRGSEGGLRAAGKHSTGTVTACVTLNFLDAAVCKSVNVPAIRKEEGLKFVASDDDGKMLDLPG
jgi:hypothetical protein